MSSWKPFREELQNLLNIIANLANNNTENVVFDHAIIAAASHPPPYKIRDHLNELKLLGLIQEDRKPTGANFKIYRITREGLNRLENQNLK